MARLSRANACGATQPCHVSCLAAGVPAWQLGRAKACGATQPCQVRPAGTHVPAWQFGRAEAYGVILQGVAPRDLARPKGLVLGNLDLDELLLKY